MEQNLLADLKLHEFRRDSYHIWQTRWTKPETYLLTAYYVREHDQLELFGRLTEDGLFGATTVPFEDGYLLSRDLLDSMNEINLMAHWLGLKRDSAVSVLDIGSGYGRLAHRLVSALPRATVVCVDAVPVSTFLCAFYVDFRGFGHRTEVVPLDQAAASLAGREFDLVTNIHSFSECPVSAIEWWLQCLDKVKVRNLLIVRNDGARLLSVEVDGTRRDFGPLLDRYGWHASRQEPTYSSEVAQRYALFPQGCFRLFSR
jgi:SAM-dependent methyltransferase